MQKILVWDWPVRIGHWLMVGGFVIAWLTSESESFRLLHVWAGSAVLSVAAFRLIWGLVGTRHARFSSFVRGPRAVLAYLASLLSLQPRHHTGHNPAGGWAILALLILGVLTGASGWAIYNELGGHWLEELHEGLAATMLAVVLVHLAGVFSGSVLHGENLVRAMFTGRKTGEPDEAIASPRPLAAVVLLVWLVAAGWWLTR
jgi:cytochrome b